MNIKIANELFAATQGTQNWVWSLNQPHGSFEPTPAQVLIGNLFLDFAYNDNYCINTDEVNMIIELLHNKVEYADIREEIFNDLYHRYNYHGLLEWAGKNKNYVEMQELCRSDSIRLVFWSMFMESGIREFIDKLLAIEELPE